MGIAPFGSAESMQPDAFIEKSSGDTEDCETRAIPRPSQILLRRSHADPISCGPLRRLRRKIGPGHSLVFMPPVAILLGLSLALGHLE